MYSTFSLYVLKLGFIDFFPLLFLKDLLKFTAVVVHGLSSPETCGIFPNQGSNPCPLHWQADS